MKAVHLLVGVEFVDQPQQVGLAGIGCEIVIERRDAHRIAGAPLVTDVDSRGAVTANEDRRQAGATQSPGDPTANLLGQLRLYSCGDALAIDYGCGHGAFQGLGSLVRHGTGLGRFLKLAGFGNSRLCVW